MDSYELCDEAAPQKNLGARLREAREAKLLSIEDVAKKLYLKKEWIRDIETDNYSNVPSSLIYLRGYLRSYARLVAIPDLDMTLLDNLVVNDHSTQYIWINKKQVTASDRFMRWITYSIILMLLSLVVLWWESDNLPTGSKFVRNGKNNSMDMNGQIGNSHLEKKIQLVYSQQPGSQLGSRQNTNTCDSTEINEAEENEDENLVIQ
jgi:transcriptional regulator with XRE-family HTH domain